MFQARPASREHGITLEHLKGEDWLPDNPKQRLNNDL
jgi:hypothetical protein